MFEWTTSLGYYAVFSVEIIVILKDFKDHLEEYVFDALGTEMVLLFFLMNLEEVELILEEKHGGDVLFVVNVVFAKLFPGLFQVIDTPLAR